MNSENLSKVQNSYKGGIKMWVCKNCGNENWFKLISKREQDVVFCDDGTINYDCLGYEKQRDVVVRCECGNEGKSISDIANWKEEG